MAAARYVLAWLLLNLTACPHAIFTKRGLNSKFLREGVDSDSITQADHLDSITQGVDLDSITAPEDTNDEPPPVPDSDEDTNSSSDEEGPKGPIVNFSPEKRRKKHEDKYEKDWVVELDLRKAHEIGEPLGLRLDTDADWNPPAVMHVKKYGCVEDWNQAHPDKQVIVGDEILQVNDIVWHHNTENFTLRIKGQFDAGRAQKEGAKRVLTLHMQRPKQGMRTRYAVQRQDMREKLYEGEFTVELPVPKNETKYASMAKVLGWKLNGNVNWKPITIQKIKRGGAVYKWNKKHPDKKILEGDEILHVNRRHWLRNSSEFLAHMIFNYEHRYDDRTNRYNKFELGLRRPRAEQHKDEGNTDNLSEEGMFDAFLPLQDTSDESPGWQLAVNSEEAPVQVSNVQGEGAVASWNTEHPDKAIGPGDQIMEVNGIKWENNSNAFVDVISDQLKASKMLGEGLSLVVQRRAGYVDLQQTHAGALHFRSAEGQGLEQKEAGGDSSWEAYEAYETSHLAAKMKVLMGYWNELFPEDQLPTKGDVSSALGWLVERANSTDDTAVLQRTDAAAVALARVDKGHSDAAMVAKMELLRRMRSDVVIGAKMEVLLRYWNELFPEDQISMTGKRFSRAIEMLTAKFTKTGSAMALEKAAASTASGTFFSNAANGTDDDDSGMVGGSEDNFAPTEDPANLPVIDSD